MLSIVPARGREPQEHYCGDQFETLVHFLQIELQLRQQKQTVLQCWDSFFFSSKRPCCVLSARRLGRADEEQVSGEELDWK